MTPSVQRTRLADRRPSADHGTTAPDCPNCFLLFGSNSAIASSAFIIIEAQIRYIVGALKKAKANEIAVITVDPNRLASYNRKVQGAL